MANVFGNPDPLEGPWPECIGMSGELCKRYIMGWIEEMAPDSIETEFLIIDTSEKHPDEVIIKSDEYGDVATHPQQDKIQ